MDWRENLQETSGNHKFSNKKYGWVVPVIFPFNQSIEFRHKLKYLGQNLHPLGRACCGSESHKSSVSGRVFVPQKFHRLKHGNWAMGQIE